MDSGDERYERRLVEEASKLRVELAGVEVRLTDRIAQSESTLRQEFAGSAGTLRQEIAGLEVRMERGFGTLRADVIKWSFLFWLGQLLAMTAIMNAMLR